MENNIKYDVIQEYDLDELIRTVNSRLANGWQLAGGIGVGETYFYRAIIKINER